MRMLEYRYIGDKMILEFNPQFLKKITLYSSLAKMCADSTLIDLINIFPNRELYVGQCSPKFTDVSTLLCHQYPSWTLPPGKIDENFSRKPPPQYRSEFIRNIFINKCAFHSLYHVEDLQLFSVFSSG